LVNTLSPCPACGFIWVDFALAVVRVISVQSVNQIIRQNLVVSADAGSRGQAHDANFVDLGVDFGACVRMNCGADNVGLGQ